jgi:signal transduction histidine kinase
MTAPVPPPASAPPLPVWRYIGRIAPLALLWAALVVWLGWLLYSRAHWTQQANEADVREWLDETRPFQKSLPELAVEYAEAAEGGDPELYRRKYNEVKSQLDAMTEPTRQFSGKLPLFPVVYYLSIDCPGIHPPSGRTAHPQWTSPLPRPGRTTESWVRVLEYAPPGGTGRVFIRCDYRLHNLHRFEQEQRNRRYWQIPLVAFLIPTTLGAVFLVVRFLRRERAREVAQWEAKVSAEHQERELLETRVKQQEAERATEELGRKLLEGELEKAKIESRAAEAERAALEMKSELYASIGIMAGSYAHNIKNLLVRPNDLLTRCMEADGLSRDQQGMLREVKSTLGTVTERLQQILRTVRRDPSQAEMTRLDLNELVAETQRTWTDMAWDKWKVKLTATLQGGPLAVNGDLSHLQQAVENLVFNARDATFEMRNYLREEARRSSVHDTAARKQKLIDAAAWKGEVHLTTRREGNAAVLEVRDNGIGMTEEVRRNCLKTHFTTKRDNALYEGYSAGMGLGLSFVAVVLEHHGATLGIESAPLRGSHFSVRIPLAALPAPQ